jgi:hypothetical protein
LAGRVGLDLREVFRRYRESTVLSCITNRVITDKDFCGGRAVIFPRRRKRDFPNIDNG